MRPLLIALAFLAITTVNGFAIVPVIQPVPTLSEWGLIALIAVIGLAGVLVLRKRLASAPSGK